MSDNQHYVSKAYLDKFVHPASGQSILFPYARGRGAQRARGTKHLASANHFYLQQESCEQTNKLDEVRKKCETFFFASGKRTAGPLAKCVFDDAFVPNASDKLTLAGAAAFLRCGSPLQVHNTAMIALLVHQQGVFNRLNTDPSKETYRDWYGSEAEQKLQDDRERIWRGELFVDVGEENRKPLGFSSFQMGAVWLDHLSQMGLNVCNCHPNACFLTSDNPVILTSNLQRNRPGLRLKDAEVWFPLSYKKGLLWTWRHRGIEKTNLGHSETRVRNRNMIRWCYKEVYAPLAEDWIGPAVKEENFNPCFGHYSSLKDMVEHHTFHALDESGQSRQIVDLVSALRAGKKHDVLRI